MLARPETRPMDPALSAEMLRAVPALRRFALYLSKSRDRADDLVQETLLRAMMNIDSFQPGTNLDAWMTTILRNQFKTEYRKRRREVEDPDGEWARKLCTGGEVDAVSRLDWARVEQLLPRLPRDQREALTLVFIEGMSYERAAEICGTQVGTVKSRVNRARLVLAEMMDSYIMEWARLPVARVEESAAWERVAGSGALDDLEWVE